MVAADEVEMLVVTDDEETLRVKGDVIAVDRRKGFADADGAVAGLGAGDMEVVWIGGRDGGPTDMGRPPGVSARAMDAPYPLRVLTESTD